MYLQPSHLLIAILLSSVQGLFSFKKVDPKVEVWASKCEELLVASNFEYRSPLRLPSNSEEILSKAVKRSLIEMIDLKKRILTEFPPDTYEYIFLENNPPVLAVLFEVDEKTKNQSFNLPFSINGYRYDVPFDDAKKIFSEVLDALKYTHDKSKKILIVAYTSGKEFGLHLLSDFLSQLDESYWREASFALLGQRYPRDRRGRPIELYHQNSVFKISAGLDSLLFHNHFMIFEPTYTANLPAWEAILAGEGPYLLPPPVYDELLKITVDAFRDEF